MTALTQTTLSGALDATATVMAVAAATSFTAPGTGATQVLALIDKEIVGIRTVNGLAIGIVRGQSGTRASSHVSGATVTVAPPRAIVSYVPSGQAVRADLEYVPLIVGGGAGLGEEVGGLWDVLGLTTAGQWVKVNGAGPAVLGAVVASPAGVLTASGTDFTVSGTNAITGITLPAGAAPGFELRITPSGVFTWTAATNIAIAGTAVVNKVLTFTWNGTKWVPSYIA